MDHDDEDPIDISAAILLALGFAIGLGALAVLMLGCSSEPRPMIHVLPYDGASAEPHDASVVVDGGVVDVDAAPCPAVHAVHRSTLLTTGAYAYSTSVSEADCCGRQLDARDAFALADEGDVNVASAGYALAEARCDAVPLYALRGGRGRLYTIDETERTAALDNGWADEGVVGYAWDAP